MFFRVVLHERHCMSISVREKKKMKHLAVNWSYSIALFWCGNFPIKSVCLTLDYKIVRK